MSGTPFSFDQPETIDRLRDSARTIESFLKLVPERWTHRAPDGWPDDAWSVAMNLAHMVAYEEQLATPVMESIAAGGTGQDVVPSGGEGWLLESAQAMAGASLDSLAARLRATRERQIAIIDAMSGDLFNTPKTMLWSGRSGGEAHAVSWVAAKTFQHTWEHGNAILRIALFAPR